MLIVYSPFIEEQELLSCRRECGNRSLSGIEATASSLMQVLQSSLHISSCGHLNGRAEIHSGFYSLGMVGRYLLFEYPSAYRREAVHLHPFALSM